MKMEVEIVCNGPGEKQESLLFAQGSGQKKVCQEKQNAKACDP